MANIDNISKTPDSDLRENIPTAIFQWQNCSIFGGNIRASARPATKTKPQQPFGCAAVTQQSLNKSVTQQKRKIHRVWDAEEIE